MYLARKYELGKLFLRLRLETGFLFYVVIDLAAQKPCRLQDKGSTFISRRFGCFLGGWDEHLLCSAIYAC